MAMNTGIIKKSRHEIRLIEEAGQIVGDCHKMLIAMVAPGVSTWDLDMAAEEFIRKAGAIPTFKGYYGFPATLCTSINDEVVHGIPSKDRVLQDGDVISLDCGATLRGLVADSAITVPVGNVAPEVIELLKVTEASLLAGIEQLKPGNHLEDIGAAIEDVANEAGYGVVRNYGGHGVGKQLHEDPFIPNHRTGKQGPELKAGYVFAIEPMLNLGTADVKTLEDKWTVVTCDGKPSAHFEHTIVITDDGPKIATWRGASMFN